MHQQRLIWLLAASFWLSQASLAQQVQPLAATDDAPELIGGQPQASPSVDLGQTNSTVRRSTAATGAPGTTVAGMSLPAPWPPQVRHALQLHGPSCALFLQLRYPVRSSALFLHVNPCA